MELVASSQRKNSPESTQDSTEHHRHHIPPAIQPTQFQLTIPYDRAVPHQPNSFFQHGGESSMIASHVKEEQALGQAPVYSVEQLGWDAHELMHSMSPESADLCKNLSSQLEHLRKEFGSCYSESSSSSQLVLASEHAGPSAVGSEKIVPASSVAGSELASGGVIHPDTEMLKAAIVSHPHYPELVAAHMNCHKVGAPPEVATQIDEIIQSFKDFQPAVTTSIGVNPELDQFMVSYYSMLMKYEKEIKKTFKEAVAFCKKLEQQLQGVTNVSLNTVASVESDERNEVYETSDEEDSSAEAEIEVDPMAKDKELKEQLMRKYSGYITSLKHEFLKKKKKGKLPKDSRQQLLNWWSLHYKWPYPSESEKASLAESTGLDQKQINNWFINQRKRHWKPSDDISPLGGQASQSTVGETNSGA